jgi:hypothetical protein
MYWCRGEGLGPIDEISALRGALIRLCSILVADDADCTCDGDDKCPACDAFRALGLGPWPGAEKAASMLTAQEEA